MYPDIHTFRPPITATNVVLRASSLRHILYLYVSSICDYYPLQLISTIFTHFVSPMRHLTLCVDFTKRADLNLEARWARTSWAGRTSSCRWAAMALSFSPPDAPVRSSRSASRRRRSWASTRIRFTRRADSCCPSTTRIIRPTPFPASRA